MNDVTRTSKERNICYCGAYGGGVHTRSARCDGSPAPEPDLITAPENPSLDDLIAFYSEGNFRSGVKVRVPYRATREALERLRAAHEPPAVRPNLLRDETSAWEIQRQDSDGNPVVTCHTRVIGGVLCRWWGDGPAPSGVDLIDRAAQPPAPVAPTWTCPNCETADEFTVTHHGPDDLGAVYPVMICRICDTTVSDYRAEQIRAICQNNPAVRLAPTKVGGQ